MVGHSGNLTAAIKACEAVDNSLKKLIENSFKSSFLEEEEKDIWIRKINNEN